MRARDADPRRDWGRRAVNAAWAMVNRLNLRRPDVQLIEWDAGWGARVAHA
jgi:hypothetical protein